MRKRDGTLQEFDRQKLQTSIERTGVPRIDAINTAYRIGSNVREGTTTLEIRNGVAAELMALDKIAAETYMAPRPKIMTRRFVRNHR